MPICFLVNSLHRNDQESHSVSNDLTDVLWRPVPGIPEFTPKVQQTENYSDPVDPSTFSQQGNSLIKQTGDQTNIIINITIMSD